MSVYYDVKIVMPRNSWTELVELINKADLEQWDKDMFNRGRTEIVYANNISEFVLASWDYVKWDVDTNEMANRVEKYMRALRLENVPCRYICLSEFGTIDEIKCVGKDNTFIPFIESCMFIKQEIGVADYIYNK